MSLTNQPQSGKQGGVVNYLTRFVGPGEVVELRALKVRRGYGRPRTWSGFFDGSHLDELVKEALDLTKHAAGVYFTMNPVRRDLLARRANRVDRAEDGECASDADVVVRRCLLIDADPKRPAGVSATDDEKALALEVVRDVRHYLTGRGWPLPILADSGNGYHLQYRIDLPADDGGTVERCLRALASEFDKPTVTIDQAVHNASRI